MGKYWQFQVIQTLLNVHVSGGGFGGMVASAPEAAALPFCLLPGLRNGQRALRVLRTQQGHR